MEVDAAAPFGLGACDGAQAYAELFFCCSSEERARASGLDAAPPPRDPHGDWLRLARPASPEADRACLEPCAPSACGAAVGEVRHVYGRVAPARAAAAAPLAGGACAYYELVVRDAGGAVVHTDAGGSDFDLTDADGGRVRLLAATLAPLGPPRATAAPPPADVAAAVGGEHRSYAAGLFGRPPRPLAAEERSYAAGDVVAAVGVVARSPGGLVLEPPAGFAPRGLATWPPGARAAWASLAAGGGGAVPTVPVSDDAALAGDAGALGPEAPSDAAALPARMRVSLSCPADAVPGEVRHFQLADKRVVAVQIPAGVAPGEGFRADV